MWLVRFLEGTTAWRQRLCAGNVHATTNIAGILISSRVKSQVNWASMTAQMLARYARR